MLLETDGEGVCFTPCAVERAPDNSTNPRPFFPDGKQPMTPLYPALRRSQPVPTRRISEKQRLPHDEEAKPSSAVALPRSARTGDPIWPR